MISSEKKPEPPAAVVSSCCGPRSLFGWSPDNLPAESPWARLVDRLLPRTGIPCLLFAAGIVGLLSLAPHLSVRAGLADDGVAFLLAGSWCGLNFWRCRQAHCLINGCGWIGLGVLALAEAGIGRSLIGGDEQLVFLGILALALLFEGAWHLARGTNALSPGPNPRPSG